MSAVLVVGVVAALAGLLVLPFFSLMLRLQQETAIGHITVSQLLSPCISGDDVLVVESFVNVIVCLIAEDRLYSICKCSVQ